MLPDGTVTKSERRCCAGTGTVTRVCSVLSLFSATTMAAPLQVGDIVSTKFAYTHKSQSGGSKKFLSFEANETFQLAKAGSKVGYTVTRLHGYVTRLQVHGYTVTRCCLCCGSHPGRHFSIASGMACRPARFPPCLCFVRCVSLGRRVQLRSAHPSGSSARICSLFATACNQLTTALGRYWDRHLLCVMWHDQHCRTGGKH